MGFYIFLACNKLIEIYPAVHNVTLSEPWGKTPALLLHQQAPNTYFFSKYMLMNLTLIYIVTIFYQKYVQPNWLTVT